MDRSPAGIADAVADIWCEALGLDAASTADSFFAQGGESMAAATIVALVRDRLGMDIGLRDVYQARTLGELVERARLADPLVPDAGPRPRRVDRTQPVRAGLAQERQFLLTEHPSQQRSDPFLVQQAMRIKGRLDVARLRRAVELVSQRHELLRSAFYRVGDRVYQRIVPSAGVTLRQVEVARDGVPKTIMQEEANRGFDHSVAPLARCLLFTFAPTDHVLMFVLEHLICDGASLGILMTDLERAYLGLDRDPGFRLPELTYQFADWAWLQRQRCAGPAVDALTAYWRERLGPDPRIVGAPFVEYRDPVTERAAGVSVEFDDTDSAALRATAARRGVTLYAQILGAFLTALSTRLERNDFCVVTTLANRPPGTEGIFGPLAHDIYVRVNASDDLDAMTLQAQYATTEAAEHGLLPNTELWPLLWPLTGPELLRSPAFYFSMNQQWTPDRQLPEARLREFRTAPQMPMPGLECEAVDRRGRIGVTIRYLAGSFPVGYVETLGREVVRLLVETSSI
jgi:acyl carrier protein